VRGHSLARSVADPRSPVGLKTYYSSIADRAHRLQADVWTEFDPIRAIHFDPDAQIAFRDRELSPTAEPLLRMTRSVWSTATSSETPPIRSPTPSCVAMIRSLKRSVIELGSDHTSRVIAHACRRNAADGHASTFRALDPFQTAI
jgi:hypothetical protein